MTIKHLIYMQNVPFNGTERDYVIFSGSKIHAGRKVIILLYTPMKGAQKIVSACNERQSLGGLLQSEWFLLQLDSSWVVHLAEQFLFIVLEFQEYYKEKCRSHTVTPGRQFVFIVLEFQQYYNENCTKFIVVATNSTCVTHEVLAGVVSE